MKKSSFAPNPENSENPNENDSNKKESQDPFDISDDEDEVQDKIGDLKGINYFDIPKPIVKAQPAFLKKYTPIDWHTAFPESFNLNDKIPIYINGTTGPNIVCLHGAGHSGLSFAPLALINKNYRIISFDFRGHGYNTMSNGEDLSEKTLIEDTIQVLSWVIEKYPEENIIIMGHSMGGSVATKTCCHILKEQETYKNLYDKIQGLMVIDVVEGTAMDALPFMENIVMNRPERFNSIEKAVEYMYKSGTIKNIESARISVPPLLKEEENSKGVKSYVFKTNLLASKQYWNEWFVGLTKAFLSCQIPKTLMLAGIERMDKDLTIAQMQGKYKLSIVRNVGHIIHEDRPEEALKVIDEFVRTFRITAKQEDIKPIIGKLGNQDPNQKLPVRIKYDTWSANKEI